MTQYIKSLPGRSGQPPYVPDVSPPSASGRVVLLHRHQQGVTAIARTTCRLRELEKRWVTPTGWTARDRACRSTNACTPCSAHPKWAADVMRQEFGPLFPDAGRRLPRLVSPGRRTSVARRAG